MSFLCVISNEIWDEMGISHVKNDFEVDWSEILAAQRRIKGHFRLLNHIFHPGKETNQYDRVKAAKELKSTTVPVASLLVKDHKSVAEREIPKSRPVCGASSSLNGEHSEWVSMILDSVNASLPTNEVIKF